MNRIRVGALRAAFAKVARQCRILKGPRLCAQVVVILLTLGWLGVRWTSARSLFTIDFQEAPGAGRTLDLAFYSHSPKPAAVDAMLRQALNNAIAFDGSRDILAMAFLNDEAMSHQLYSGALIYRAVQKRVLTINEDLGVKTNVRVTAAYTVVSETAKSLVGPQSSIDLTLVYPKAPAVKNAYAALVVEITKLVVAGLDPNVDEVAAFAFVGNAAKETTWQQLRDPTGGYVFVYYDSKSRAIKNRGTVLKRF